MPEIRKQIKEKEHRRKSGDSVDSSESGETRQKVAQFVDTSFDKLNKLEHIVDVFRGPKPQVMKVLPAQ